MRFIIIATALLTTYQVAVGQHEPHVFDRKKMKGEFKHFNLTSFSIDSLSEKEKEAAADQNDNPLSGQDVYYSLQKNVRGLTEFTVFSLELGEVSGGYRITYLIYNNKGVLLSFFDLAHDMHELSEKPSYYSRAWGKFLNKATYELTEEINSGGHRQPSMTKTLLIIRPDGKIERKSGD